MAAPLLEPFAAIRPRPDRAADVIARPYDVISFAEARAAAAGRPLSFLHVSRAEIDLPDATDPYAPAVYGQAAAAFAALRDSGTLVKDETPGYYAYRMDAADGHSQTGIAGAATVAAYESNHVRRHEHTRPDKEMDRTRQILAVAAHTGPVLTAYPPEPTLAALLADAIAETADADADAVTDDGTRHRIWRIGDSSRVAALKAVLARFEALYIADGHHRSAAGARVFREFGAGDGHFLTVAFPADRLRILGYHRLVKDLGGLSAEAFLDRCGDAFAIAPAAAPVAPERRGVYGLFVGERWYRLELKALPAASAAPVARLDVTQLSACLLRPVLGIGDERTDPRIEFVGGGRGLGELERRVRSGEAAAAFSLFPTAFADVIAVADAGQVMPPKSTWFEPKLADGLLSLPLGEAT
jgi:uncharacterized protein (DUF1015 family)